MEIQAFRRKVTARDDDYLTPGKQLYQWLIAPVHCYLKQQQVDTLIFVPDGALRTIPMAALVRPDGRPLIEDYAVVVSPGLSTRTPGAASDRSRPRRVLVAGTAAAPGEAALPYVEKEMESVGDIFGDGKPTILPGHKFTIERLLNELRRPDPEPYAFVHIASHCVLSDNGQESYILTGGGEVDRLGLPALASGLRVLQLRGHPLELLTLSACRTSVGDNESVLERASLGLGALAVKAGARSALGSLWSVNDQATPELMRHFYDELRRSEAGPEETGDSGEHGPRPLPGKAQALRRAQQTMIDGGYSHPFFWAGFVLFGDWM
jgi:CHAT domain-containing protein